MCVYPFDNEARCFFAREHRFRVDNGERVCAPARYVFQVAGIIVTDRHKYGSEYSALL